MRFQHGIILALVCCITGCGMAGRSCNEAREVAHEEYGPRAALRKYEWFKDAAAALDNKQANIKVYQKRLDNMIDDYDGTKRRNWDRTDKEQFNQWESELVGLKASYNKLSAEYNANMAKINWKFADVGGLPPGASTPLPRSYKPYEEG
jgi:hypothetical protein